MHTFHLIAAFFATAVLSSDANAAPQLSAWTSDLKTSSFVTGSNAELTVQASGFAANERRDLSIDIRDWRDAPVRMMRESFTADAKGGWQGSFRLPTDRFGCFRVYVKSGDVALMKRGSRPAGLLTYMVTHGPRPSSASDAETFFGAYGSTDDMCVKAMGLRHGFGSCNPHVYLYKLLLYDMYRFGKEYWTEEGLAWARESYGRKRTGCVQEMLTDPVGERHMRHAIASMMRAVKARKSPGEHLVIEVLNIPDGSRTGEVKVAVEITDENGAVFAKYGPSRLDETKMCEARYEVDSAALAAKARAPRVRLVYEVAGSRGCGVAGSVVVADGLHPIDLAPANTWNHNAVKQAIRDQLRLTKADLALKDGRFTASFAADEPIRFAMLCGNGCIQYVQGMPGSAVERFRDVGDDWAVFQISPVCVGRHDLSGRYGKEAKKKGSGKREEGRGERYTLSVPGVAEAEWLYVNSVTNGETLALDDINEHATPPIFLRVPKAKLPGLKLKVDYLKLFRGEVPLDVAYGKTSYSVGKSIKSMQVTVTRFPLQARYPSVANANEVSFSVPVDADRDTMTYHAQLVGMSGRVWYSKPFVVEKPGPRRTMRLWNAAKDAAETIELPSARVPNQCRSPLARTRERHRPGERRAALVRDARRTVFVRDALEPRGPDGGRGGQAVRGFPQHVRRFDAEAHAGAGRILVAGVRRRR